MHPHDALPSLPTKVDLVVVGAGAVGLAHAVEAQSRGLSVLVLDAGPRPDGSTARRGGHVAVTTQDSTALGCALATRERWLKLGREAGFGVRETGTVVVARHDDELAVLDDLVASRAGDAVRLDARQVRDRTGADRAVGGVHLPLDLRIEPASALTAAADWLGTRPQVHVAWSTAAQTFDAGSGCTLVRTPRGDVIARRAVVAAGRDVDRLFFDVGAELIDVRRQMLRIAVPDGALALQDGSGPVVAGPGTLLRDAAYRHSRALGAVRERLRTRDPRLLATEVHPTLVPLPDGTAVVGDGRAPADEPGRSETVDEVLLREAASLCGSAAPVVLARWTAPELVRARATNDYDPFVVAEPLPYVRSVTVLDGLATTTALGLAPRVLDELF